MKSIYGEPSGVALSKEACPICGKIMDGAILLATLRTKTNMQRVDDMHGKVIGIAPKPCEECQELMKMGVIVVMYDESKTDTTEKPFNPYRTGDFGVLRAEAVERIFEGWAGLQQTLKQRVLFIDLETAEKTGILDGLINHE